jgi:hypothetical protein
MNTKSFTELLKTRQNMNSESASYLTSIIDEYPYFQAARAISLKNLKNNDSFKYNSELKKTAAYTTDRTVLFDFITSAIFTKEKAEAKEVHQQIIERASTEEPVAIEEELEIGKPISFTQTETHSFNQWLQISTHKKIVRKENKRLHKTDIIDNFIKQNPKISKVPKDSDKKEVSIIEKQDSYLMTETLAKVYLEQKKYENAMKAYEILSLKYPEKSGFFADQIKRIRILQNK